MHKLVVLLNELNSLWLTCEYRQIRFYIAQNVTSKMSFSVYTARLSSVLVSLLPKQNKVEKLKIFNT